jgi:ubiquinone/menaquinone biosynthesis C-methylase UbiE
MDFYRDHVYPHLVNLLGDPHPIREIRQRVISLAQGKVLEIGAGSGLNFAYYDPTQVPKLYALEPNSGMIRLAEKRRQRTKLEIEFLGLPGEQIPLEDRAVDTVVSTFTLCTISSHSLPEALRGIRRVLKPSGKFIFIELGLSPDARVQAWQKRWEPIHHRVFQGLHLTRDIPSLVTQGGFQVEEIKSAYFAEFPKSWTHYWWGAAGLQSRERRSRACSN